MVQIIWALCLMMTINPDDVVENGMVAKGKQMTMTFERNLRLGPDTEDEHLLWTSSIVTMAANSKGHMFVLDGGGLRVLHFDQDGNFVGQIGKQGMGPGEFLKLSNLSILSDDRIVVSEYRLGDNFISYFDAEGTFLNRVNSNAPVRMFSSQFSPDGKHMSGGFFVHNDAGGLTVTFGLLSKDRKVELALSANDLPDIDGSRMGDPTWWPEFLAPWFRMQPNQGLVTYGLDGSIFTAVTGKYSITRYSPDLKQKLVFTRKYKPRPLSEEQIMTMLEPIHEQVLTAMPPSVQTVVTEQVVNAAVKKADLPPVSTPISGMVPTEDGGLLVIHNYNPQTYQNEADIFDKNGKLIGSTTLPPIEINIFGGYFGFSAKMLFKNGVAYTIESSDGDYYLNRYTYTLKEK